MNINKFSNMQFKGAYVIMGRGKDVKEAENRIKYSANNIENMKTSPLGYGYTTDDMPAYLLVTTGGDTKKYNQFALHKDEFHKSVENEMPEEYTEADFDTKHAFLFYRIMHQGDVWIKAIKKHCNFDNPVKTIDAKAALFAMKNDTFNYNDGTLTD